MVSEINLPCEHHLFQKYEGMINLSLIQVSLMIILQLLIQISSLILQYQMFTTKLISHRQLCFVSY